MGSHANSQLRNSGAAKSSGSRRGQRFFDRGGHGFRIGLLGRLEPGDGLAVLADEKFPEIPFHVTGEHPVLAGERGVERVTLGAFHVDFFHQRETDRVLRLAELADFLGGSGLLGAEVVAGKRDHRKALRREFLMDGLQRLILRRESAFRGGVDHQHHLALEVGQRGLLAGEGLERNGG